MSYILKWSENRHRRFYSMDVVELLTLDTSAQWFTVNRSTIPHPDAELDLLASQTRGKVVVA